MRFFGLILSLLVTASVSAQIQRGDRFLSVDGRAGASLTGASVTPLVSGDLGGIVLPGTFSEGLAYATPAYGLALTDRLIVGGSLTAVHPFGSRSDIGSIGLSPYLRYYGINRAQLGVYGQVMTGLGYRNGDLTGPDAVTVGAGLQLPLAVGARFGPSVDYVIGGAGNTLELGIRVELILGRNNRLQEAAVGSFSKGAIMLGSQFVGAVVREDVSSAGVVVGGHYFLTDRLTAAPTIGMEGYQTDFSRPNVTRITTLRNYAVGLSSRYYLTTERHLLWFAEAGVGYQTNYSRRDFGNGEIRSSSDVFLLTASAGGQLFIRDNVALEAGPQFRRFFGDGVNYSLFSLNGGIRFLL
ncbi:hypothetical protein [Neolewinella maritima]|uniref:hypothetical protein n=1 Tax=Neolewinella maritima TaxID=1383882 RepID=UPI001EE825F2|nr:hypothetical protein [Neolewinella maritima]